jgi:NAD(P)-dependent dehydrogenase (short-subunit alcohol dehydrogenase family)
MLAHLLKIWLFPMNSKVILITGCSSGIGYEAALALSKRSHRVICSCRRQEDVDALNHQGLTTLQLDVTDPASVNQAFEHLVKITDGRLDVLINNAGYGQAGALEDISTQVLFEQFATNVFGVMEVIRHAIPMMRKQQSGRIINISSVLGLISLPFRGAYNASKYAVEGLSDTLRLELKPSGIDVICIEPGPIESRFRDTAVDFSLKKIDIENSFFKSQYQQMLGDFRQKKSTSTFTKTPDAVIKKLIHAIESKHPKAKYPVTIPAHGLGMLKRILPVRTLDYLLSYISKKEMK